MSYSVSRTSYVLHVVSEEHRRVILREIYAIPIAVVHVAIDGSRVPSEVSQSSCGDTLRWCHHAHALRRLRYWTAAEIQNSFQSLVVEEVIERPQASNLTEGVIAVIIIRFLIWISCAGVRRCRSSSGHGNIPTKKVRQTTITTPIYSLATANRSE